MKLYSYLLIFSLFSVSLVSVSQNLIPFENKGLGLQGFRNQKTGRVDIECRFDEVNEFTEKITSVRIGQLWGFIDPKGKMVIAPKFEQVGEFSNGKVWVKNYDGAFRIDEKGKIAVSLMSLYLSLLMVSCLSVKDYVASRKGTNGDSSTNKEFLPTPHLNFSLSSLSSHSSSISQPSSSPVFIISLLFSLLI